MSFSMACLLTIRGPFQAWRLSKGYDLISRSSEDIDITVFREDLGQGASVAEEAMSHQEA